MISSGYRTRRGVTGPMNFKKSGGFFFGKSCTRDFGAPVCHPNTLIDLSNTALAIKCLVKTLCMISEGYRTHRYVTGPMSFKKSGRFSREIVLPGFGAPGCHPSTLIDPVNPAVASIGSAKTKGMISEGYRTHRGVTGPMNFKSRTFFFFGKTCSRGFWGSWLPSKHCN